MRIGIFGGTFNPVHKEHINIAVNAKKELKLDKLIIVPTFMPPHKNDFPAPPTDRLNMLSLAFSFDKDIEISDFEIENGGKSYSFITVEYFKEKYADATLFFIVGGDMLVNFKKWKNPQRILDCVTLAVFNRENFYFDLNSEREYFKNTFGKDFVMLSYIGKDCSSTEIRVYNSLGLDIKGMTDGKVADYIKEKGLYPGGPYESFVRKSLTEKRLIHTANVVVCALKKAKELNLDTEKVVSACVLHDSAKYTDYKKVKGFVLPDGVPDPVVHAFLGAYIAEHVLSVKDGEVIDAIRYHTSGKADMSVLGKLVFVADMVEKGRVYEGVEKLRYYYDNYRLDDCFRECLKEEVEHLINKKTQIYIETLNAYDYYVKGRK